MGFFSLPVRYRGQEKTCKICNQPGHFARDCEKRGKCFVCGSMNHRAYWHEENPEDKDKEDTPVYSTTHETDGSGEDEARQRRTTRDNEYIERDGHRGNTSEQVPK